MNHEKAVKVHLALRAKRVQLKREYEAQDEIYKSQIAMIEAALLGSLLENKVSSMGTGPGSFYKETLVKPSCSDWELYRKFMIENDAMDGVEKRVSSSFIKDYLDAHKDVAPPGIDIYKETVVRVRTK